MRSFLHIDESTLAQKIDSIQHDQFLATPDQDLVEHFFASLKVEPLTILESNRVMVQEEIRLLVQHENDHSSAVPAIKITITYPFTGHPTLWKIKPTRYRDIAIQGWVKSVEENCGNFELVFQQPADEPQENIKSWLSETLGNIRLNLKSQASEITESNDKLERRITSLVEARRQRLFDLNGLSEMLDIPLKRNDDAPEISLIPIARNIVKPLPQPPETGYEPEPGIHEDTYKHILDVIRHVGATFECTPSTYAVHDEEELRDIILAHLNGHYKGAATGETFRKSGKTDIRIESESRAAFVAECKVWSGQSDLIKAVDQLLGYLTWRDCKSAIVIFNKNNKKFSELIDKIPEALESHPNCRQTKGQVLDGEWHYVFQSINDESRLVQIRAVVFDVYHQFA